MVATDTAQEILLDDATPGMRLAEAVLDRSGARLISPGVELTEKSIHALRQRGVLRVNVVVSLLEQARGKQTEESLQRLDVLFKNSVDSKPNRLLLDSLRRYRTRTAQ